MRFDPRKDGRSIPSAGFGHLAGLIAIIDADGNYCFDARFEFAEDNVSPSIRFENTGALGANPHTMVLEFDQPAGDARPADAIQIHLTHYSGAPRLFD
jgi:hypothetical protein